MPKASAFPLFWKFCMFPLIPTPQQSGMWKKCNLGHWGPACRPLPGEHLAPPHKGELVFLEGEWGGGWSSWEGKRAWEQLHQLWNPTCRKQLAEQRPPLANAPAGPFSTFCYQAVLQISLPWEILCLEKKILGGKMERKPKIRIQSCKLKGSKGIPLCAVSSCFFNEKWGMKGEKRRGTFRLKISMK